jgi:hypothetical protein
MTKWTEMALRPQGQPWPGLNTRGGKLDPGAGYLEDGSFNAVINEADLLEKRKGFVRGLNERFDQVVCGLFRYTSECGIEYLVVADRSGISVRTPFSIPSYLGSDSLPFDDFEELDTTRWSPTTAYEVFIGALQLNGADLLVGVNYVDPAQLMQWFKESVLTSYYVETNYRLEAQTTQQATSVVIKRTAGGTSYLEASVVVTPTTYIAYLYRVSGGVRTELATAALGGVTLADGFLRLSYDAGSFVATATITPSGGDIVTLTGQLTEAQDAGLGQLSAVGLQRGDTTVNPQIESVSGGQI